MNIEQVKDFINNNNWTYAKSYSKTFPHCYLQKDNCTDKSIYEEFAKYIITNGTMKRFFSKEYIYLEVDGFEYWQMGRPSKIVQVINQAPINDKAKHRGNITPNKNNEIILKEKILNRDIYLEKLLNKENKNEQDLKQIEFLTNTTRRIHGGGKNIIDNSKIEVIYE